jgi:hypothetical protein
LLGSVGFVALLYWLFPEYRGKPSFYVYYLDYDPSHAWGSWLSAPPSGRSSLFNGDHGAIAYRATLR